MNNVEIDKPLYIGVDIGGTKCSVVLADEHSQILIKEKFDTKVTMGPKHTIDHISVLIHQMIAKYPKHKILAIGISCGGPLDSKNGIILSPPNLPGWDYVQIVKMLRETFNIPVFLQNDANACALAEWKFGAGKGYNNVIFLTFGTGMGAGLILDGRLYSGSTDMAGEIGHVRLAENGPVGYGKIGSFEGFCSGGGIAQLAKAYVLKALQKGEKVSFCKSIEYIEDITAYKVAVAASEGDLLGLEIYNEVGKNLGKGLSILMDILNPEMIIIGSIYTRSHYLLENMMRIVIEEEALALTRKKCIVSTSILSEQLGDIAAISVGIEGVKTHGII